MCLTELKREICLEIDYEITRPDAFKYKYACWIRGIATCIIINFEVVFVSCLTDVRLRSSIRHCRGRKDAAQMRGEERKGIGGTGVVRLWWVVLWKVWVERWWR